MHRKILAFVMVCLVIGCLFSGCLDNTPAYTDEELRQSAISSVSDEGPSYSGNYITRTYTWTYNREIFSRDTYTITLQIPKGHYDYYKNQPHTRDYNSYALSDYDRQLLNSMIEGFKQQGEKNGYSDYDNVMNVIAFVQSLPYTSDSVTTGYDEYPRYPIETLVDGGGDCEDSSILAAALLSEMGYGIILVSPPGHMALGIKGSENLSGSYYEYNGSRYYYVETTSSGWGIGKLPPEFSGTKASIYPMKSTPSVSARLYATYDDSDSQYVYYKIRCDIQNLGPASAKNISVYMFAEAPPFDKKLLWPPGHNIYVGSIPDDGTGQAEAIVRVPRGETTRFTCQIYGENFESLDLHSDFVNC